MRTIQLPGTDISTFPLGLGCASLGSRISRAQGLRSLAAAHDAGISWFDVSPAYGAGEAEGILGAFVAGRRDRVVICSKVGLAPPRHNGLMRSLYALGRPVIGLAQGLRRRFRQVGATRNVHVALTPELIETSLDRSLKRLGTDYLDIFALHDPAPHDVARDDVLQALERLKAAGKVRHLAIAGTLAAAEIAVESGRYDIIQLADTPETEPLAGLRRKAVRPLGFVTHSILGIGGAQDRLIARLGEDRDLRQRAQEAGYSGDDRQVASALLMQRAFASNPDGVVLASMFSPAHLAANLAAARAAPEAQRAGQAIVRGALLDTLPGQDVPA